MYSLKSSSEDKEKLKDHIDEADSEVLDEAIKSEREWLDKN